MKFCKISIFIIIFTQSGIAEADLGKLTWIDKIEHSVDDTGISIQLNLKKPLKTPPLWKKQGKNIIFSVKNAYINPSKMDVPVESPFFNQVKVVQFKNDIVRVVFYGKESIPDDLQPYIAYNENNLQCMIKMLNPTSSVPPIENKLEEKEKTENLDNNVKPADNPQITDEKSIDENNITQKETENKSELNSENSENKPVFENEDLFLNLDKDDKPEIPSLPGSLVKAFTSLLIIIGLIILTVYLLKRFLFSKGDLGISGKSLKMLSNIYIGDKKRVCIVEVLGKILVLGVTNSSITLLSEIEGDKVMDIVSEIEKEDGKGSSFRKELTKADNNFDDEKINKKAKDLSNIFKNLKP